MDTDPNYDLESKLDWDATVERDFDRRAMRRMRDESDDQMEDQDDEQ